MPKRILLLVATLASSTLSAPVVGAARPLAPPTAPPGPRESALLRSAGDGSGLATSAQERSRLTRERAPLRLRDLALGADRVVSATLERFEAVAPGTRVEVGPGRRAAGIDLRSVALYRGSVEGHPESSAFLAVHERGVIGQFDLGPGAPRFVLVPRDRSRRGLVADGLEFVEASGFGAPPLVEACQVLGHDHAHGGGVAGFGAAQRRLVEVAADSDFEFFERFGDLEAAAIYVAALFGAIDTVYRRELDVGVALTYLRLWDSPEDLFNEPNPLGPFRDHWNEQMGDVPRDAATLLTGRRNLPYGGVAYLSALCGPFAYSVNGYLNGSFAGDEGTAPGNWDLVVCAHELGHNCGTLHTHDYGLDDCAGGQQRRGGIMSYCHTVSGGVGNVDLIFETPLRQIVKDYLVAVECVSVDCDGNGIDDSVDILEGRLADGDGDGIPDLCQDCDGDGVLDPEAIALGLVADLDGDGVPDSCQPDCNGNGVPDALDIALGDSVDLYLDGVPDECEPDCDGDGISDIAQIQADMTLDIDRNRVLDACQDCDGDGVPDLEQLQGGLNLWIAANGPPAVEIHGRSGVRTGAAAEHLVAGATDLLLLPDGRIAALGGGRVATFDPDGGGDAGTLVPPGIAGMSTAGTMLLLPPSRLLVSTASPASVLEFDAATGALVGELVKGAASGLVAPFGMAVGADGALLVAGSDASVRRYDATSGAPLGVLVPSGGGGLESPRGMVVLPDGSLLVASASVHLPALLRYDGVTGAFLGRWDKGGVTSGFWGLREPWALRLADDGTRLLASNASGSTAIHSYDLATGMFLRSFYVLSSDAPGARGFVELPRSDEDCNGNFLPDACDIADGRSADLNRNGVPDECEGPIVVFGDLDGSGVVDGADLGLLLGAWGRCAAPCAADLDGDGVVDGADLGLLLGAWTV